MRMRNTGAYLIGIITKTGKDGRKIDIGRETNSGEQEDIMKGVKKEEAKEEETGTRSIEKEESAIRRTLTVAR